MFKGSGICARLLFGHVSSYSLVETDAFFFVYLRLHLHMHVWPYRAVTRSESQLLIKSKVVLQVYLTKATMHVHKQTLYSEKVQDLSACLLLL